MTNIGGQIFEFVFQEKTTQRLDKAIINYIFAIVPSAELTRSQLKLYIETGLASVNRQVILKAGHLVHPGYLVKITIPKPEPLDLVTYKFDLKILFEDQDLLVIDKPFGLSMHPGAGNKTTTLVNALLHYFGSNKPELFSQGARPGIVHRLDRDTTGVIVVAKTAWMLASLAKQFSRRTVTRSYVALVLSTKRTKSFLTVGQNGTIETLLGRDPSNRKRMAVLQVGGKLAITHWTVLDNFTYGSLLSLKLGTGRTHQIRVHLSHLGVPVIGDPTYGNFSGLPNSLKLAAEKFGRQALHAKSLAFTHPKSQVRLEFESAIPDDMQTLIEKFRTLK